MKTSAKLAGAGVVLAAAAAASAYFLTGKRGKKNRQKIAAWTLKMQNEVVDKMKELKEINMESYYGLVDEVAGRYSRVEGVAASELKHLKDELKNSWEKISKELK
ncbi:MAG: hypothetical protein HY746_03105 [Elusimicrobia bacterium]|nr:hypothetical protein [Elusimicrobiota bacterium]